MIKLLFRKVKKGLATQVDATGLGVFRICYAMVLFCEVLQLYRFRHLVYDKIPFVIPSEITWAWPLTIWLVVIAFVGLGLFCRWAVFANYLLTVTCMATLSSYEYHMFYAYTGINFLLLFIPTHRALSLDRWRVKARYALAGRDEAPRATTSILSYKIPVFVGIALVYTDSIFHKAGSEIWMNGLGVWFPASLPMITQIDSSVLLNLKWLALGLGYLTLVFELVFIFVFWFRKFWWVWLTIGLGLHVGILVEFPIPWFALGVCGIYLLLVPPEYWAKLKRKETKPTLQVYFDEECPLCRTTRVTVEFFDWLGKVRFVALQDSSRRPAQLEEIDEEELYRSIYSVNQGGRIFEGLGTYKAILARLPVFWPLALVLSLPGLSHIGSGVYGWVAKNRTTERCTDETCGIPLPGPGSAPVAGGLFSGKLTLDDVKAVVIVAFLFLLVIGQIFMIVDSPFAKQTYAKLGIGESKGVKLVRTASWKARRLLQPSLGTTYHGVFMDAHFAGYEHQIKITHAASGEVVPVTDADGKPGEYLVGFNWVKWTFRVNGPHIDQDQLRVGIRDFTAFWLVENGFHPNESHVFVVEVRKLESPKGWTKDYYRTMMARPWVKAGNVKWEGNQFSADLPVIEDL